MVGRRREGGLGLIGSWGCGDIVVDLWQEHESETRREGGKKGGFESWFALQSLAGCWLLEHFITKSREQLKKKKNNRFFFYSVSYSNHLHHHHYHPHHHTITIIYLS